MIKDLTTQDFLDLGYTKVNTKGINNSTHGLRKRILGSEGTNYFITVFCYENREYSDSKLIQSFDVDLQFSRLSQELPAVSIQLRTGKSTTVQEIEEDVERIWSVLECDCYD